MRLARKTIDRLTGEGKTVKLLLVGKKARAQLARDHRDKIVETVDLSHIKRLAFSDALVGRRGCRAPL